MKRLTVLAIASLVLSALPAAAGGAPVTGAEEGGRIVAVGGTQLSNGVFLPGTAECDRQGCRPFVEGTELEIERGQDVVFTNLDPYEHANTHSVVSIRTNKKGRPLFRTKDIKGPAEVTVKTSHLRPGAYPYFCRTHFGMYGILKVVRPQ